MENVFFFWQHHQWLKHGLMMVGKILSEKAWGKFLKWLGELRGLDWSREVSAVELGFLFRMDEL